MKTTTNYILVFTLILVVSCNGQTPEQRKQAAETEAMVAEMQRKADSMMNDPEMKKKIEETMKILEAQEAKYEKESAEEEKIAEKKPSTRASTDHLKDFLSSKGTAKKIDNWQFGAAELYILKYLPFGKDPKTQQKIGTIGADGGFDFILPEKIETPSTIAEVFKCEYHESSGETEYSDPTAGIGSTGISVIQGGERIGEISIASSRQQAYNFSPMYIHSGYPGYRMNWSYVERATSAKVVCDRTMEKNEKVYEMRIIYDLQFRPGWNLVKGEMLEAHSPLFI